MGERIFSIGHSNQALDDFLALLKQHGVEILADVRSHPVSRYATQFNAEDLRPAVVQAGIRYLFLGRELGGRPRGAEFYDRDGHVMYDRLAAAPYFQAGIERLENDVRDFRVAIMCSEEDPRECHRHLLVGRVLARRGIAVHHIRGDGRVETDLADPGPADAQGLLFREFADSAWRSPRPILPAKAQPDAARP